MSEKISHASRKFMPTPASRIDQAGAQRLVDEGARVGRLALLPFQADEAADGQPVQACRWSPARVEHRGTGREADAELVDAHVRAASHEEVARTRG